MYSLRYWVEYLRISTGHYLVSLCGFFELTYVILCIRYVTITSCSNIIYFIVLLTSLNFDFLGIKSLNVGILFVGYLQEQDDTDYTQQQEEEKLSDILTPGVTPELPRYAPQCQWAPLSGLDPDTLTFPGGAPIQLHTVPPGLLPRIPLFYVCTRCGKVFWEGSHFGRVLSMFQEVLHITDEDTESAAAPVTAAQQNWLSLPDPQKHPE